jgi:ubiquinone/menaquinone biosynthesis C-methylase UbiE
MSNRVCPWWLGYTLIIPLRRLQYDPRRLLAPYVHEGMTVLEPGPGMGYFTLELARLVGPTGRVVAMDVQPKMLARLKRRAEKAGLLARLDVRVAKPDSLGIDDATAADFALAFAVVHEVPDAGSFFSEVARALKPGGSLLLAEPKGHVKSKAFQDELQAAERADLTVVGRPLVKTAYVALLKKN